MSEGDIVRPPLRVLTFLHSFEPGGVERIALRLVRRWRALGIAAPLMLGRDEGAMAADVGAGLAPIVPPRRWPARPFESLWMIATLPAIIRRERPDVLFCAGNTYAVVAVAMKLLLGRACPPVVAKISNDLQRRDLPWWGRFVYHLWLRLVGRLLDHVVGMEEASRAEIVRRLGIADPQVSIVHDPAVSEAAIAALSRPRAAAPAGGGRRFVAVGRLVAQKRLDLMLDAFARGRADGDRLTIIGDGPERPRLAEHAAQLGLTGHVSFLGYCPAPIRLMPRFDVLLLASDYEGVPAVLIEALAAGLAIVATDCSVNIAPLLQHGRLGALVPVGDVAALADAIGAARPGSPDPAASRAQAARFTLEAAAARYILALTRTARAQRARRPRVAGARSGSIANA